MVILHGALRKSADLADWGPRLAPYADCVLVDLPGHGLSPPSVSASVESMSAAVAELIRGAFPDRRTLLVGESLGGTVALAVAGLQPCPIRAVFAADPPMTTTKLWSVQLSVGNQISKAKDEDFWARLGRDAFGMTPNRMTEIIYYDLLEVLAVPAVLATGDVPLQPPRLTDGPTCVFDAVDEYVALKVQNGKVAFERIHNAGHLLLADAPDECLRIIRGLIDDHLGPGAHPEEATGI